MAGNVMSGISRAVALTCGLTISVLAASAFANPAYAGSVSGGGEGWSARVDIPDFTWTHYGCNEAPVTVTTSGVPGDWVVIMPVRLSGSGNYSDTVMASGETAGTYGDVINLCPSDLNGTYLVSGVARGGNPEVSVVLDTQFVVSPMASNTVLARVETTATRTVFSGTVTATSATLGGIGGKPGTSVQIQRQTPEGWVAVATGKLDNVGNYRISAARAYHNGGVFRASYLGATEIAGSISEPISAPTAIPSTPRIQSLVREHGRARLIWNAQGPDVTYMYRISYPGKTSKYAAWKTTADNQALLSPLVPKAKYRVQIVAVSAAGTSKARTRTFVSR